MRKDLYDSPTMYPDIYRIEIANSSYRKYGERISHSRNWRPPSLLRHYTNYMFAVLQVEGTPSLLSRTGARLHPTSRRDSQSASRRASNSSHRFTTTVQCILRRSHTLDREIPLTIRVVLQLAVWVRVGTLPCGGVNPGSHLDRGGAHVNIGHWILDVTLLGVSVAEGHVTAGV